MTSAVSRLLQQAADVPVTGSEADDWRARNLSELLLHARITGSDELVAAVDRAAAALPAVFPRFADRLRATRRCFGPVPPGYPEHRSASPPAPWPSHTVRLRAARLARVADACPATAPDGLHAPSSAQERAADLDDTAPVRVLGRAGHRCVDVDIDAGLMWREWLMDGATPTLAVGLPDPARAPSPVRAGLQLHMGAHLDHLAELTDHGGAADAARLQFGTGLLVAESVAMSTEIVALAGGTALGAAQLSALYLLAVDRLSRLPGIAEWGERVLPDSPAMAAAARATNREFTALPRLAEAYVSGPFALAERDFTHPLIPPRLRWSLKATWHAALSDLR